jgi:hypothetical protein
VDPVTGYLTLGDGALRGRVNATTGYLELDSVGSLARVNGSTGYLELAPSTAAPAAMFLGDRTERPSQLHALGYDGFVRVLELGAMDDEGPDGSGGAAVLGRLVTRPLLYGDPFRRKKPKRLLVSAEPAGSSADIAAAVLVDGATASNHELEVGGTSGEPVTISARCGGRRGYAIQADLQFEDDVTIQAVGMLAEPLKGSF